MVLEQVEEQNSGGEWANLDLPGKQP